MNSYEVVHGDYSGFECGYDDDIQSLLIFPSSKRSLQSPPPDHHHRRHQLKKGKSSEEQNEDDHCENGIKDEQGKSAYLLNREVKGKGGHTMSNHSLAERVRRERINERMKFLQDLVPGCNKITGKALMLDEIINYVQSLQRQVEFLSMKLATYSKMEVFDMETVLSESRVSNINFH